MAEVGSHVDGVVVGSALLEAIDRGDDPGGVHLESEAGRGGPMIVVLAPDCSLKQKAAVVRFIEQKGGRLMVSVVGEETQIGLVDADAQALAPEIERMPGVRHILPVAPPYPHVSLEHHPEPSEVEIGGVGIGGSEVVVMAGPCSVEGEEQLELIARSVASAGARMLRGGAFKPRSSPYSFQGLGEEGLALLAQMSVRVGLPVVTEVVAPEDVDLVASYAQMLQIGARNMQNFRLLSAAGAQERPVLLKRGIASTVEELLLAAEYIVSAGNPRVVLCERGIRTFETTTRNTLDISAVPVLKARSHLPVVVDPSHAAGDRELVPYLARAAVACGADGILVEVHNDPDRAHERRSPKPHVGWFRGADAAVASGRSCGGTVDRADFSCHKPLTSRSSASVSLDAFLDESEGAMEQDVTLSIHLSEDDSTTVATAVLDLRGDHFEATGKARRNPIDPVKPLIGEELAIARALRRLESQITEAAEEKIDQYLVH